MNDFGGGIHSGETFQQTAIREFVEETETMFFENNLSRAGKTPERIDYQVKRVTEIFERTLSKHPDWHCQRNPGKKIPPKNWRSFFIEFDYRNVDQMNQEWKKEESRKTRFSKRRELIWVGADQLLSLYHHQPEKLWKRVRQLESVCEVIQNIQRHKIQ